MYNLYIYIYIYIILYIHIYIMIKYIRVTNHRWFCVQTWDDHQLSGGLSEGWLGYQNMDEIEISEMENCEEQAQIHSMVPVM